MMLLASPFGKMGKQVLTFTRDRKMTAQEMRETAGKLFQYVDVENPQVTERQEVDYYLANTKVYQEVVEHLPEKKKYDTDGNRLPEAKIYQAAVDSIDPSKLGYTDDEKKDHLSLQPDECCGEFCDGNHYDESVRC